MAIMSAPAHTLPDQPNALLQYRSYVAYWFARTTTNGAYQMHPELRRIDTIQGRDH